MNNHCEKDKVHLGEIFKSYLRVSMSTIEVGIGRDM
jgi:hypothetical protein